jgi:hypothetical protein
MTSEYTVAELRLAGRVARDLWPQGRVGRFLLALADEVADGTTTAKSAREDARHMLDRVCGRTAWRR